MFFFIFLSPNLIYPLSFSFTLFLYSLISFLSLLTFFMLFHLLSFLLFFFLLYSLYLFLFFFLFRSRLHIYSRSVSSRLFILFLSYSLLCARVCVIVNAHHISLFALHCGPVKEDLRKPLPADCSKAGKAPKRENNWRYSRRVSSLQLATKRPTARDKQFSSSKDLPFPPLITPRTHDGSLW